MIIGLNIQHGITKSFDAKLDALVSDLEDLNQNNDVAAINSLSVFVNAVEAQKGKAIMEKPLKYTSPKLKRSSIY